ncbi:MAG: hypothetical protein JWN64_269 [Parcubacteria group bacterium]|nr:hypothetical protein [Parcubacteria group bacterium]
MATIINNPGPDGTPESAGAGGWIVALIAIIVLVLLAMFLLPKLMNPNANLEGAQQGQTGSTNNNGSGQAPAFTTTTVNSTTTVLMNGGTTTATGTAR